MENSDIQKRSYIKDHLDPALSGDNLVECLSCGACSSMCSWFEQEGGPVPRQIMRMVLLGLDDTLLESGALWDCLLCGRCTVNCPMEISMARIMARARAHPGARDQIPEDIRKGIQTRLEVGDVNGLTREDFVDTVEWIAEELEDDVGDPDATIPYDRKGARYLYLPNPRELSTNVLHLSAMVRLFYAAGADWTMSSRHTDTTNWGFFTNDTEAMRRIALSVVEPAEELGIGTLVLSECGHGYHVLITLIDNIIGRKPGFEIISMPEVILEYVKTGAIKLDPQVHLYPVAYHDPCNVGRKSHLYEAPRELLSYCCSEVAELYPNRENGICCGGGGGAITVKLPLNPSTTTL